MVREQMVKLAEDLQELVKPDGDPTILTFENNPNSPYVTAHYVSDHVITVVNFDQEELRTFEDILFDHGIILRTEDGCFELEVRSDITNKHLLGISAYVKDASRNLYNSKETKNEIPQFVRDDFGYVRDFRNCSECSSLNG